MGNSTSTPAGVETPDVIDLRKPSMKEADNNQAERPLYQVLEQKEERTASAGGTVHCRLPRFTLSLSAIKSQLTSCRMRILALITGAGESGRHHLPGPA
uniref:Uncharacterized protein n=2 Tax=Triticum urartu TaxID=4572 RepID=A0A8R7QX06_TRIUA